MSEYKIVSGIDYNRIGFLPEQDWGVSTNPRGTLYATDATFYGIQGSMTSLEFSIEPARETRGAFGTPRSGGVYSRSEKISGSLSMEIYGDYNENVGMPVLSFLGMAIADYTPKTETEMKIRQSSDMRSFSIWAREYIDKRHVYSGTPLVDNYEHIDYLILGAVITSYEMTVSDDGKTEFKVSFEAIDYHIFNDDGSILSSSKYDPYTTTDKNFATIVGASAELPANTFDSMSPMMFFDYDNDYSFVFTTGSYDYDIRTLSIKVANTTKNIYNKGKRTPKDIIGTKQEITGKFSIMGDRNSVIERIKASANTNADGSIPMGSVMVKLVSPSNNGIQFTFSDTMITNGITESINPIDDDEVVIDAEFVVVGDGVTFTLINDGVSENIIYEGA